MTTTARRRVRHALAGAVLLLACAPTRTTSRAAAAQSAASAGSFQRGLVDLLHRFHTQFNVYSDASAAGNHFAARGCIASNGVSCGTDDGPVPPMNEAAACPAKPGPGTCVMAMARLRQRQWGGWYFLNGVLPDVHALPPDSVGKGLAPDLNWGDAPDAGVDLTGATEITFDVFGEDGGRVEFFALGVGHDPETHVVLLDPKTGRAYAHPDSSPKVTTGNVMLTRSWQHQRISLRSSKLSYVLGGFGWVVDGQRNGGKEVRFWIDNVAYDKPRPREPRFPLSYDTTAASMPLIARPLTNVAYTYDAAVTLTALTAAGDLENAGLIADAFVTAQNHDRLYTDGRLRNAYQAGDLFVPPGWTPNGKRDTVRVPGWYDETARRWFEDEALYGSDTGNLAWAMLGLLSYIEGTAAQTTPEQRRPYVEALVRLGTWIENNCRDPRAGYTGGFETPEDQPTKRTYRSTEHNIDLYAAFSRLGTLTGDRRWIERAEHARAFVMSMFHRADGSITPAERDQPHFWTGTLPFPNDDAINTRPIPLDVQSWAALSLGARDRAQWSQALAYAERHMRSRDGFSYSDADTSATWHEGTAQMALVYRVTGRDADAAALIDVLRAARRPSGLIDAASAGPRGLETGFGWQYFRWPHIGATAWALLAERGVNPFAPMTPQ